MPVSVGSLLNQTGAIGEAGIAIDGVEFSPSGNYREPSELSYEPPTLVGHACSGRPFFQGPPTLVLHWENVEINTYQALCVLFFSSLNSPDGPLVTVTWPDPQEAGRYVAAQGYMEWPKASYKEQFLRGAEVRITSFRQTGSGYF